MTRSWGGGREGRLSDVLVLLFVAPSSPPHPLPPSLLTVNAVSIAHKKARYVNLLLQNDAPSSNENRTPPRGAPKAEDTPEAAPQETKSRWGGREGGREGGMVIVISHSR